jgi:NADPH:quinone reductase-like Zn-dependent oxidoreductase
MNAAWLGPRHAHLEVKPAPYTHPLKGEIVVQNHAVAVNPLEWILQLAGNVIYPWIKYPFVMGSDVAGEVVEVGDGVTRFVVGDRVLAHAVGTDKDSNSSARGAFQQYTVVLERMASPIPTTMAYESAAVLPLGLSTASCGLFQQDQLALDPPSAQPVPKGQTLLVWGGSTSVGSNAIQLAVAAGYDVIATAGPHNFDYVKQLGAREAFDYHSPTVVSDVIAALRGKKLAGALAVGTGSAERCADIIAACDGRKFIAIASTPASFETLADSRRHLPRILLQMGAATVSLQLKTRLRGIGSKFIFGTTLKDNEVSTIIYRDFLPRALAEGRFLAVPEPMVVGDGLDQLQAALDLQRRGVSARKVVVTL